MAVLVATLASMAWRDAGETPPPWTAPALAIDARVDQLEEHAPKRDLDAILATIRRFHTRAREAVPTAPGPTDPVRPPLHALAVAMVVGADGDAPLLALASRDPAHPERYVFHRGGTDRDARFVDAWHDGSTASFVVERGSERHTFQFAFTARRTREAERLLGMPARRDGNEVAAPRASSAPVLAHDRRSALRGVPFYVDGHVVGVRATGIRRDSWLARAGVCEGDVVAAFDDRPVTDVVELGGLVDKGQRPRSIAVLRPVAGRLERISIAVERA